MLTKAQHKKKNMIDDELMKGIVDMVDLVSRVKAATSMITVSDGAAAIGVEDNDGAANNNIRRYRSQCHHRKKRTPPSRSRPMVRKSTMFYPPPPPSRSLIDYTYPCSSLSSLLQVTANNDYQQQRRLSGGNGSRIGSVLPTIFCRLLFGNRSIIGNSNKTYCWYDDDDDLGGDDKNYLRKSPLLVGDRDSGIISFQK